MMMLLICLEKYNKTEIYVELQSWKKREKSLLIIQILIISNYSHSLTSNKTMNLPIKQGQKAFPTPQSLKLQIKPCVPAQKMHSHIQQFKGFVLEDIVQRYF